MGCFPLSYRTGSIIVDRNGGYSRKKLAPWTRSDCAPQSSLDAALVVSCIRFQSAVRMSFCQCRVPCLSQNCLHLSSLRSHSQLPHTHHRNHSNLIPCPVRCLLQTLARCYYFLILDIVPQSSSCRPNDLFNRLQSHQTLDAACHSRMLLISDD